MNVTHDVVSDLWPLYASGEASADTRALVDTFLAGDPAFGRIVSDTSFDVSPKAFIATAAIAVAFWIAFFVGLWRVRARILVVAPKRDMRTR